MIAATHSFRTKNVKPQALSLASKLMHIGADREYIIERLYRTKTLATLKLWGQALNHLEHRQDLGLVSTLLTREDFIRSGASEYDLYDIIDELIANSPEAKMILLLHESIKENDQESIYGILQTQNGFNAKEFLSHLNAAGDKRQATFVIKNKTLKQVESEIIAEIEKNHD